MEDRSLIIGERWAIQQYLKDKAKRYREKSPQAISSDREFYLEIATLLETVCTEIGNAEHWR